MAYHLAPWPHFDNQQRVWAQRSEVVWIPPEEVYSPCQEKFPNGCWLMSYRGGGLHLAYGPEDEAEFLLSLREATADARAFWSKVAGRDITFPRIAPKAKAKASVKGNDLTLDFLGL